MPDHYEADPLYRLFAERLADLGKELERVFTRSASKEGLDTVKAEQATVRAKVEELERIAGDLKPVLGLASANAQRIARLEEQVWKWAGVATALGGGAGFGLAKMFGGGG